MLFVTKLVLVMVAGTLDKSGCFVCYATRFGFWFQRGDELVAIHPGTLLQFVSDSWQFNTIQVLPPHAFAESSHSVQEVSTVFKGISLQKRLKRLQILLYEQVRVTRLNGILLY